MKHSVWSTAMANCADPPRARRHWEQLMATSAAGRLQSASPETAQILVALLAGSQSLSASLIANPEWINGLTPELLQHPREKQGLLRDLNGWLAGARASVDYTAAFDQVRRFKQREMLRVATRDLARLATASETIRELSDIADVCLEKVCQLCQRQFTERFGRPYHLDADANWQPTGFCILGLGKLGGQELNYSSDIDLIFVYADEGHVFKESPAKGKATGRGLTNHQYFKRLAETFIAEVTRMTTEGTLFRTDLRLRPEGEAGPLVRSLPSYESYYAQWGQIWERMMLIKARPVAADESLAAEFLEVIQPFRYPRSLHEGILREVTAMKERIENEVVKAGELDRNVKLGRGGIREIEFTVQTLQLLNAGRVPFLQGAQTLPVLAQLVRYQLMRDDDAKSLSEAYCFLRDVEHRLQMEDNLQTHTIPTNRHTRERLAALMGCNSATEFEVALRQHTGHVRQLYNTILQVDSPPKESAFPLQFEGAEAEWKKLLAEHSFKNVDAAFRLLNEFANGPGYAHVSSRTVELARQLLPRLFTLCPRQHNQAKAPGRLTKVLSDPDRVLTRLDSFITAYGARAMLFETWTNNPSLLELLLLLFDRSEFLAETAIRTPDLLDELVLSGRLRQRKTAEQSLKELRHGQADKDQHCWLRRYHQAELMRIGLRDILGLADPEQNLIELSALAAACLQYALEVVQQRNRLQAQSLAIIGLGKLGGEEINYGSDLDILFVADCKTSYLPKLQRLAAGVMELLSSPTNLGGVFITDTRLRPDGEKGLLVNTIAAHEEYYRQRAQLWEIQSLTRARPVAGDKEVGEHFRQLAATLTNFQQPDLPLNAYTREWMLQIHQMRLRIQKERTPAGKDALAIKTGTGGLLDAEFVAQAACLAHGWQQPKTIAALQLARDSKLLNNGDTNQLIENYQQLRRIEGILRRWSYEGETTLPDEPAALGRVAIRCGFGAAEEFMQAVANQRKTIREVYNKVFDGEGCEVKAG